MRSHVKNVGTCRIVLESRFILDLVDTFYVSSYSRNLISISKLDKFGFAFKFENSKLIIMKNSMNIGSAYMCDGLYRLKTKFQIQESHSIENTMIGNKRGLKDDQSYLLWHRRLGHISKERVQRLVKERILGSLDFTNIEPCVDCIKAKQSNTYKKDVKHSNEKLEIVHTDVCGPFSPCYTGEKYFITFIDNYSRYMYLYLLLKNQKSFKFLRTSRKK